MIHLKTILHPTDFSEDSRYALAVASALARDQAARMILLHVVPRPVLIGRDRNVPAYKEAHAAADQQSYRQEMADQLEKLRGGMSLPRVETLLKEGDVAGVIARTAEETACNLIIMGSHGKSRQYQHLMGSVAEAVTRKASCPVLTVRLPVEHPALAARATTEATSEIC
jgi:nucleotide-binding universal stress UspA family protein